MAFKLDHLPMAFKLFYSTALPACLTSTASKLASTASKINHISEISLHISKIFYCMKAHFVRDHPKINQISQDPYMRNAVYFDTWGSELGSHIPGTGTSFPWKLVSHFLGTWKSFSGNWELKFWSCFWITLLKFCLKVLRFEVSDQPLWLSVRTACVFYCIWYFIGKS